MERGGGGREVERGGEGREVVQCCMVFQRQCTIEYTAQVDMIQSCFEVYYVHGLAGYAHVYVHITRHR